MGKYLHHAMPSGATAVPIDPKTNKREVGGYNSYIKGGHILTQMMLTIELVQLRKTYSQKAEHFSWIEITCRSWD